MDYATNTQLSLISHHLGIALNAALSSRERDRALYRLIELYQAHREAFLGHWERIAAAEDLKGLVASAKEKGIEERIFDNVLSRVETLDRSLEQVMSHSLGQATEWAARASRNPVARVLMIIAGPTFNCGSGVVVEALAREHQKARGSIAVSVAYEKPVLPEDLSLDDTAIVDTIIFSSDQSADSALKIPVFSAGMPFGLPRYKDMKLIELIEFVEVYHHRLRFLIDEYRPDIIHTNHLFLLNPLVQLIAPWIPVIATTHGTEQKMLDEDSGMAPLVVPGRRTPITGQLLGLNKVWLDGLSGPRDPSQVSRGR